MTQFFLNDANEKNLYYKRYLSENKNVDIIWGIQITPGSKCPIYKCAPFTPDLYSVVYASFLAKTRSG